MDTERDLASEARHGGRWITRKLNEGTPPHGRVLRHIQSRIDDGSYEPVELGRYWAAWLSPASYGTETSRGATQSYARTLSKGYDATARSVFLPVAEAMVEWPIYRAAVIRAAVPVIIGTALGKAEARFNDVFEDKSARGLFKEGMSIAQSIYRRALLNALD